MATELRKFIEKLEKEGELITIEEEFSPIFEIPSAMRELDKKAGKAVLFKNTKGYNIPIAGNLLGSRRRLAIALGVDEKQLTEEYADRRQKPIKPKKVANGEIKEVIKKGGIDLLKEIPALTHHKKDVSPYLTTSFCVARDPDTGLQSMGLHRVQLKDKDTIGIYLGTPPLSEFLRKAEEKDQALKIALVLGADPLTFFSSVVWAPEGIDKMDIAGGLNGEPIELVQCELSDLLVPARAEIILEGEILPKRREKEGPFGESTGYYFTFDNPVGKIQAITRRKEPIYHALTPFTHEESILINFSWETDNLKAIQKSLPHVQRVHFPPNTLALMAVVQIEKKSEEEVKKTIEGMFAVCPFTKVVVLVDTDVDPEDAGEIQWALSTRFQPDRDLITQPQGMGLGIDPSAIATKEGFVSSRMALNLTKSLAERDKYEKIDVPQEVKEKMGKFLEKYS